MASKLKTSFRALFSIALCILACSPARAQPSTRQAGQAGKTGFVQKSYSLSDGSKASYVVFVPHDYDGTKDLPVILFLHGSGETKGGQGQPKDVGLGAYIRKHEKTFRFLVIFPQAQERGWQKEVNRNMALGILDKTLGEYKTDSHRVYLTGLSMGGAGTWSYAMADPARWAAIVPICGRGNPQQADKIKDIPCWVFHGAQDPTVPVTESRQMVAALKAAGGDPTYTEFPKAKHNSWDQAYATPGLWGWLANQKRK